MLKCRSYKLSYDAVIGVIEVNKSQDEVSNASRRLDNMSGISSFFNISV